MTQTKTLHYNLPQLMVRCAKQKIKVLEWGRGTGKSTVLATEIEQRVFGMPRASFFCVGETYQQILTRTLPSTIRGLEMLGYYKDIHYVIGKKFPKSWNIPEPLEPPLDYKHYMHWITGAGFHLVSLDLPESGRGLNTMGGIGDECALFDYEDLFNNVIATNRAGKSLFSKHPLWLGMTFSSTTPMNVKGRWMFKYEEQAKQDPSKVLYLRASAKENAANLPDDWFRDQQRVLPDLIYNAEILNIRPTAVDNSFYPNLKEKVHTYVSFNYSHLDVVKDLSKVDCRQDNDLIQGDELQIGLDFGSRINTCVVGQYYIDTYRIINSLFVLNPLRIPDLANKFADYYDTKHVKNCALVHDETGLPGDAGRYSTYIDQFQSVLESRGWVVRRVYIGKVPHYHARFTFFGELFSEQNERLPRIRINSSNCKYLLISMFNAPVHLGRNGFEKGKESERDKNLPQEEATHFSDAFDTLVFGLFALLAAGVNHHHYPTLIKDIS